MIKVQAYERNGVQSDKVQEEFEFCCWINLEAWMDKYNLYNCKKKHYGKPDKQKCSHNED